MARYPPCRIEPPVLTEGDARPDRTGPVVGVGAGYDGRTWRFAKEGVPAGRRSAAGALADNNSDSRNWSSIGGHVLVGRELGGWYRARLVASTALVAALPSFVVAAGIALF